MTFLLFSLSAKRYGLAVDQIREVLPNLIDEKSYQTGSSNYMVGLISYQGQQVPIIDLCMLHENRRCRNEFSTRIVLINNPSSANNSSIIGLLVEKATETIQLKEDIYGNNNPPDIAVNLVHPSNPSEDVIQLFNLNKMLPGNLSELAY